VVSANADAAALATAFVCSSGRRLNVLSGRIEVSRDLGFTGEKKRAEVKDSELRISIIRTRCFSFSISETEKENEMERLILAEVL